jgi:hypothetical protein
VKEELQNINEQLSIEAVNWEDMKWSDKAKLFRYWSIFNFFGNVVQIFAALFFLFRGNFGLHISDYLSGIGCMFAYIGLVQYLDYSAKYSFILKTLSHAVPVLVRTLVGIIPIFIGAVLLSISLFSSSYRFHTASFAAMNLYSMIAGDELQDVFRDLTGVNLLLALIFLYLYVFFGVAVITNTFIAIAEQGFSETKSRSRFEWAKQLKKNETEPPLPPSQMETMGRTTSLRGGILLTGETDQSSKSIYRANSMYGGNNETPQRL